MVSVCLIILSSFHVCNSIEDFIHVFLILRAIHTMHIVLVLRLFSLFISIIVSYICKLFCLSLCVVFSLSFLLIELFEEIDTKTSHAWKKNSNSNNYYDNYAGWSPSLFLYSLRSIVHKCRARTCVDIYRERSIVSTLACISI